MFQNKTTCWKSLTLALLVSSAGVFSGCGQSGPTIATVSGTVLLDGQPLDGVMVEFQPKEAGRPSIGYTDDSGTFKLRYSRDKWGALIGEHTVRVDFDVEAGGDRPRPKIKIPKKYNVESELSEQVSRGKNDFQFQLISEAPGSSSKSRRVASR